MRERRRGGRAVRGIVERQTISPSLGLVRWLTFTAPPNNDSDADKPVYAVAGPRNKYYGVSLIIPDDDIHEWPNERFLRQGVRANGWVLLDRVSLWYEIWRNMNGFPPVVSTTEPKYKSDAQQYKPDKPKPPKLPKSY